MPFIREGNGRDQDDHIAGEFSNGEDSCFHARKCSGRYHVEFQNYHACKHRLDCGGLARGPEAANTEFRLVEARRK